MIPSVLHAAVRFRALRWPPAGLASRSNCNIAPQAADYDGSPTYLDGSLVLRTTFGARRVPIFDFMPIDSDGRRMESSSSSDHQGQGGRFFWQEC